MNKKRTFLNELYTDKTEQILSFPKIGLHKNAKTVNFF